ncbi:hypothetical protein HOO68_03945 [Candidatus Gracilibacteria bacterium]|nr:hypothetical protein [Candidatus Gracilibacteria bacterium]
MRKIIVLEDKNFSINSDGWKKSKCIEYRKDYSKSFFKPTIVFTEIEEKVNPEGDIWEIGEEQYFTLESGRRELKKAGKRIPTTSEWEELSKKHENLPLSLGVRCQKNEDFYYTDIGEHGYYLASDNETGLITTPKQINQISINKDDIVGYSVRCIKN